MPFVSEQQRRACWAQYHRDIKAGKKHAWDCKEWGSATMPKISAIELAQQDLLSYSDKDLAVLAKYYSLPKSNKEELTRKIAHIHVNLLK